MCGVAGLYAYSDGSGAVDRELLSAMVAAMSHRGPDGRGIWLCADDGIGLGNCRLAIVDRSAAGGQPMANEDGTIQLSFNGEIYNHAALRSELERQGHRFRSRSDTEVIVHAYEAWGLDCFARLVGMWGLALWDGGRKTLVLARDRLGIKPLYYEARAGRIRFASEIKGLLAAAGPRPELDLEALSLCLTYLCTPTPRTLWRGVNKLPPSHLLLVERGREPELRRFWEPLAADNPWVERAAAARADRLEAVAVESIRELLATSVERRLMADVPVGLFLSGGIDSSTIAALMRQRRSGRLAAFTIGYDEPGYADERPHSRRVAQRFDCELHEVVVSEQDLIDALDDVLYQLDEPNADWMSVAIYYLARRAHRTGTTVILSGEGSDELFGGYAGYLRAGRLARVASGPLGRQPGAGLLPRLLGPAFDLAERFGGRARGLRDDLERIAHGEPAFIGLQIGLTERLKRRVLAGAEGRGTNGVLRPSAAIAEHLARARGRPMPIGRAGSGHDAARDALGWISYLELKQRLPDLLLARLDTMTMAHSVEGRVPFLDHELVELLLALPGSLRLRGGVSKYLLKRAAEAWLPADVVHRPKVPFGAPVPSWLRGRLGRHVEAQVAESGLVRQGILRGDVILGLIAAHRAGAADHAQAIWSLYTLCRWYDVTVARSAAGPPEGSAVVERGSG